MLNLAKEVCGYCTKNINIGQFTLECESCTDIIHAKCYSLSNYKNIDNMWLCSLCCADYRPRYNPFLALHNDGPNSIPEDTISSLQNITQLLNTCKSHSTKDFNNLLSEVSPPQPNSSLFSTYFLNIDGNLSNFNSLTTELHRLEHTFSVIGLAETNCKPENKDLYNLSNYTSFYQKNMQNQETGKDKKKGTGVALYVHNSLNAVIDQGNSFINKHIESLFISITNMQEPVTIGVVYRPPSGNMNIFLDYLGKIAESLPSKNSYIMGDFNINLHNESDSGFHDYEETLLSSNFSPLISVYTHDKPGCRKSCIDNIHTNNHENVLASGTISDKINHHLPIFHFSNIIYNSTCSEQKHTQYYNFSKSNLALFVDKLDEATQNFIVDDNFQAFQDVFTKTMDDTCKLSVPKTSKRNNINNPWITDGIIHSVETKHKLYKSWKRTVSGKNPKGDVEKLEKYREHDKRLKKVIKYAKSSFHFKKFDAAKGDMKKTWEIVNEIRGKTKKTIKPLFIIDNKRITDRRIIATKFNEYFISIAEKMNSEASSDIILEKAEIPSFLEYMGRSQESSIYMNECTAEEIMNIINEFENGKASDIPIKLIKQCSHVISPLLSQYYNIFMIKGEFPDLFKVGKISPVYKKDDEEKFENYRPVSTLPLFGKIFEKIIYSRLYSYLSAKGILQDNQFGFRKSHSTSHALNYSVSEIRKYLNDKKHVIGIYIDLSKAFDTLDHNKLLSKLSIYGIRGNAHSLLKSYLSGRVQYTNVLGESSEKLSVKYGVPQGSVLGPLLFLLYINDIRNCNELGLFVLFADDTNIFVAGDDCDDVHFKANSILHSVYKYMRANLLHINMSKTCYMHFTPHTGDFGLDNLFSESTLKLMGIPIKCVTSTKFLGVTIDNELSWGPHIVNLTKKLNCQAGALNRIKSDVPQKYYKDLYHTLFESHLSYCISVWGGVGVTKLKPLFIAQKSCMRILFGEEAYLDKYKTCARCRPLGKQIPDHTFYQKEHTKPLFRKHELMTVHNLYSYRCIIELLKILKFRAPYALYLAFDASSKHKHERATRHKSIYINMDDKPSNNFTYKAGVLWKHLSIKLGISDFSVKINPVKSKLKTLILSNQNAKGDPTEWSDCNLNIINDISF